MPTRSFVLDTPAERRFWDISWDAGDVEITAGKWGTNGRVRAESFASPGPRDAFVTAQIEKILKKGYRETGAVAPAPDAPGAAIASAVASLSKAILALVRPAWLPVFEPGDRAGHGRVRGSMTLAPGESWPACASCRAPLTGLFELDCTHLPAPHLRGPDVIQLFCCEAWSGRDSTSTGCIFDGWLARRRRPDPGERRRPAGRSDRDRGPATITGWTAFEELPPEPDEALRDRLEAAEDEVLRALVRSAGGALDEDDPFQAYRAFARAVGKPARGEHKLGGWPMFVQEPTRPHAHSIFQIEERAPFHANFGDAGAGHLLARADGSLDFFWASH